MLPVEVLPRVCIARAAANEVILEIQSVASHTTHLDTKFLIVRTQTSNLQSRRKQSPDGQAQLDVGGEVVNNSRAKRAAKIWTLVFLAVRRRSHCTSASNWDSKAWKFSRTERKSYTCALRYVPAEFYYSNSRLHKINVENVIMSQVRLRMVRPWPDQLDRFRCL